MGRRKRGNVTYFLTTFFSLPSRKFTYNNLFNSFSSSDCRDISTSHGVDTVMHAEILLLLPVE